MCSPKTLDVGFLRVFVKGRWQVGVVARSNGALRLEQLAAMGHLQDTQAAGMGFVGLHRAAECSCRTTQLQLQS